MTTKPKIRSHFGYETLDVLCFLKTYFKIINNDECVMLLIFVFQEHLLKYRGPGLGKCNPVISGLKIK